MNTAATPTRISRTGLVLSIAAMGAVLAVLGCLQVQVGADARALLSLIALNLGLLCLAILGAEVVHPWLKAMLDRAAFRRPLADQQ